MRPHTLRAIVFDFDGTLASLCINFDTMRDNVASIATRYFHKTPPPCPRPVLEWIDTLTAQLHASGNGSGVSHAFGAECATMLRDMEVDAAQRGGLFTYTRPLLRALDVRGVRVGIITRNCASAVRTVFPDADALCGCVLTREDAPRVKPHPDHLLQALRHLNVAAPQALMVGDHPMDIETGRNAGSATAGVASGRVSTLTLMRAGADIVARDCNALLHTLDRCGMLPELAGSDGKKDRAMGNGSNSRHAVGAWNDFFTRY